jgi:hypothetical protein
MILQFLVIIILWFKPCSGYSILYRLTRISNQRSVVERCYYMPCFLDTFGTTIVECRMTMTGIELPIKIENDKCIPTVASVDNIDVKSVPTIENTIVHIDNLKPTVGWMDRLRQLHEFQQQYGHTMVPKRYKDNPTLGNWVSKQRQMYHNYRIGIKPCSLTVRRIELLNQINFCWNATGTNNNNHRNDNSNVVSIHDEWWSNFEELRIYCLNNDIHQIQYPTKLGLWLNRQRKLYKIQHESDQKDSTELYIYQLSKEQILALTNIHEYWWMTRRQWQWENRYRALQSFSNQVGHCCVPISYPDKQLAHWVSNQRKQYNLRQAGKQSELTPSRINKLEAIGFVWNRWDYEFNKKKMLINRK